MAPTSNPLRRDIATPSMYPVLAWAIHTELPIRSVVPERRSSSLDRLRHERGVR